MKEVEFRVDFFPLSTPARTKSFFLSPFSQSALLRSTFRASRVAFWLSRDPQRTVGGNCFPSGSELGRLGKSRASGEVGAARRGERAQKEEGEETERKKERKKNRPAPLSALSSRLGTDWGLTGVRQGSIEGFFWF